MANNQWTTTNQRLNPRELQYMNILLALAYRDRATFETFGQLELLHDPTLRSFFRLNMEWGSITLCILSEATKRRSYSFGPALKLITDLNRDQAIQWSQISRIINTALWIYSEKNWPNWSSSSYNFELKMSLIYLSTNFYRNHKEDIMSITTNLWYQLRRSW